MTEKLGHGTTQGSTREPRPADTALEQLHWALGTQEMLEAFAGLGFTLDDLATATGVEERTVRRWQYGATPPIRSSAARALGDLRAISLWALKSGELPAEDFIEWCRDSSAGMWLNPEGHPVEHASPLQAISSGNPDSVANIAAAVRDHFPFPSPPQAAA